MSSSAHSDKHGHDVPMRPLRLAVAAGVLALAFILPAFWQGVQAGPNDTAPASREYLIKAAFLYDMLKVVEWPKRASGGLRLCVLGRDRFGAAWKSIEGKPIGRRVLVIQHTLQVPALSGCDALFVGDSETGRLPELMAAAAERPLLTVSELSDFGELGGIVTLREANNKLRFDINPDAARRAGIGVPDAVLQLADIIGDDRATPQQGQR